MALNYSCIPSSSSSSSPLLYTDYHLSPKFQLFGNGRLEPKFPTPFSLYETPSPPNTSTSHSSRNTPIFLHFLQDQAKEEEQQQNTETNQSQQQQQQQEEDFESIEDSILKFFKFRSSP